MNNKDKKKSKIEKLRDLILEEKSKNQEEIIDFYYEDKDSKIKVLVHDKRKIKVALLEMEEHEWMQKSNIKEFECQYNPKTDDPIDEQNGIEDFEYEPSSFEQNLEDALQEMTEKLFQNRENQKNISIFFRTYLSKFSKNQQIIVFYYYFLGFGVSEIAEILNVKPQTIDVYIKRIDKKLAKFGKKCDL